MQFDTTPRRARGESIVPMINVVFLLLIFFLMTAQITPPAPFEVRPPKAARGAAQEPGMVLYVAADGALAYGAARGDAVFAALVARARDRPLILRVDAALPGADLAALLPRLAAVGQARVTLTVAAP